MTALALLGLLIVGIVCKGILDAKKLRSCEALMNAAITGIEEKNYEEEE